MDTVCRHQDSFEQPCEPPFFFFFFFFCNEQGPCNDGATHLGMRPQSGGAPNGPSTLVNSFKHSGDPKDPKVEKCATASARRP